MPGFAHAYADVNGTRIHYVVGGNGPAVVLLHGWPHTWSVWQNLMPPLASEGFTVIAPDLRGIGDSDKPRGGYSKVNVATDVHELVQELGFDSINLVGMDIGTMVAFAYAATFPHDLDHLVLAESVIPGFGLEELMNPATGGHWHFGFFGQVETATMLVTGHESEFIGRFWKMGSSRQLSEADRTRYLSYYSGPEALRGGFEHYGTLLQDGRTNRELVVSPMQTAVLVLNGDKGLSQGPLLEGARRAFTHVEADIVPTAGHTFGADNPEWSAKRLTDFFRG
jgi:pimeloyl-ACP methyl ester carboxylesterase